MADFENCLISGIFGVFSTGFLHRTNPMFLYNGLSHIFGVSVNFCPKLCILQRLKALHGLRPLHDGRF